MYIATGILKDMLDKYKLERKTIDELLSANPSKEDEVKYLTCRRFISGFISDLEKICDKIKEDPK